MAKRTQATSGNAWRDKSRRTEVVKLPSGNFARIRPVAVDVLVSQGKIPDMLGDIAASTLFDEVEFEAIAKGKESRAYVDLINAIVPACFAEPVIVDKAEADDEIELSDIDWADKVFVFQLALLPTEALKSFRPQQDGDVENVSDKSGDVDKGVDTA